MKPVRRTIDTEVSAAGEGRLRAVARLTDPYHDIEVTLTIRIADLSIVGAAARMPRIPYADYCPNSCAGLNGLQGVRVGAGLGRTIRDAVGGDSGCPYLVELVGQACKLAVVAAQSENAREAVLVENDLERFSAIRRQMGQCAGHRGLPDDHLPAWLERERRETR